MPKELETLSTEKSEHPKHEQPKHEHPKHGPADLQKKVVDHLEKALTLSNMASGINDSEKEKAAICWATAQGHINEASKHLAEVLKHQLGIKKPKEEL